MTAFYSYHPLVNLVFFVLVLIFAMFFIHPLAMVIGLLASLSYGLKVSGGARLGRRLFLVLPLIFFSFIFNPLFNHAGQTTLAYFPSGNPLTMESIIYGGVAGAMLATVILWFISYNQIVSSDKFIYLFGRIIPALSLVVSMALRFIPLFKEEFSKVYLVQKSLVGEKTGRLAKVRQLAQVLSVTVTWALDQALDRADSMRARGYGLRKRTAYSLYRFTRRDAISLGLMVFLGAYVLVGVVRGRVAFAYFPALRGASLDPYGLSVFLAYLLLSFLPFFLEVWEDRQWMRIQSEA